MKKTILILTAVSLVFSCDYVFARQADEGRAWYSGSKHKICDVIGAQEIARENPLSPEHSPRKAIAFSKALPELDRYFAERSTEMDSARVQWDAVYNDITQLWHVHILLDPLSSADCGIDIEFPQDCSYASLVSMGECGPAF